MDKNGYVMDAKEYFEDQWGLNDMDMFSDIFSGIDMVEFAKEYHLAKSKEENAVGQVEDCIIPCTCFHSNICVKCGRTVDEHPVQNGIKIIRNN
jgi:hypothetical protein